MEGSQPLQWVSLPSLPFQVFCPTSFAESPSLSPVLSWPCCKADAELVQHTQNSSELRSCTWSCPSSPLLVTSTWDRTRAHSQL